MKPTIFVLAALAALSVAAAPAAKKSKAKAKPTATPAVKVVAPTPTPEEPAMMDSEHKVISGDASYKLGKDAVQVADAGGTIQTSSGFKIATLTFSHGKSEKLQLGLMYTGPGPLDQGYITTLLAVDGDGRYHAWKKGVGDCSVNLTKATSLEVEGSANCPKGLLDLEDRPAKPITELKFKVKADPKVAAPAVIFGGQE